MADPAYLQPYQGLHDDPYDAAAQDRAKRGYVGGLLDSVTDAAGQLPATALRVAKQLNPIGGAINSYQQAKSLLSGDTSLGQLGNSLLDLTPIGPARDAVKASGDIGTAAGGGDSYGAGQATGKLLGAGLAVMPGVGPEARAVMRDERAAAPIIAYHGSPHDFDKFGFQNIGGGEGGQAFGHGLYFAENEGVARSYRDSISGNVGNTQTPLGAADRAMGMANGDRGKALEALQNEIVSIRQAADAMRAKGKNVPDIFLNRIESEYQPAIEMVKGGYKPGGHMYEVGIHADPAKFLDWDKPLSQQGPDVGRALAEFGPQAGRPINYGNMRDNYYKPMSDILAGTDVGRLIRPDDFFEPGRIDLAAVRAHLANDPTRVAQMDALLNKYQADTAPTGRHAYENIAQTYGEEGLTGRSQEASERLGEAGIPGIRYLDQGSRGPSTIYNVGAPRPDFGPYSPFTSQADAEKHLELLRGHGFKDAEIKQQVQPQTSNYVVFPTHDEIIKIMRKYGLAPLAAGGAAAATVPGLLNGDDASSAR